MLLIYYCQFKNIPTTHFTIHLVKGKIIDKPESKFSIKSSKVKSKLGTGNLDLASLNGIFWHVLMFSICQHTLHFNIFYILQTEILLIFVPIFLFVSVFLVLHFEKKLKPFSLYQFSPLVESFEHRIFLPLNSEESNIWRWWTLSTSFSPLGLGQSIYLKGFHFK